MFSLNTICLQTQYIKSRAQIRTYGVVNLFALLNFRDQKLTFDYLVEIQKQTALEEDEEFDPEPKKRTVTV